MCLHWHFTIAHKLVEFATILHNLVPGYQSQHLAYCICQVCPTAQVTIITSSGNYINRRPPCRRSCGCSIKMYPAVLCVLFLDQVRSGTDLISLLILLLLFFFFFLLGRPLQKSLRLRRPSFQIGSGWNLAGLFLELIRIDWRSRIFWSDVIISKWRSWRHFTEKSAVLLVPPMCENDASAARIRSSVRQFLIYNRFVRC